MQTIKSTFTPGPWEARSRSLNDGSLIVSGPGPDYDEICQVRAREDRSYSARDDRDQANAPLLAAAPELLEELEELVDIICGGERDVTVEDCDAAKAAIAKAKGEV